MIYKIILIGYCACYALILMKNIQYSIEENDYFWMFMNITMCVVTLTIIYVLCELWTEAIE